MPRAGHRAVGELMLLRRFGEAGSTDAQGRAVPYRMRHSQGAQWDFMLIQPIERPGSYFSADVQARESDFRDAIATLADFEEDWFVEGPPHDTLKTTRCARCSGKPSGARARLRIG